VQLGEGENNSHIKELNTIIDKTISNFFPKTPHYHIFPYLWDDELQTDSDFFYDNQTPLITTPGHVYESDDLKTISHLSLFHKNRIAYDPKSVNTMLRSTGLIQWHESVFSMGIYRKGHCGDSRYSISKEDYDKLKDEAAKEIKIGEDLKITRTYFDGIDYPDGSIDLIGVK
jgi:hypothetical protein